MRLSRPKWLISLEAPQEQLLATVKSLALKNETGSLKRSTMIKYESLHFPKLLQPNAATEFCDHSDLEAIAAVVKGCTYSPPTDTATVAKGKLKELLRHHRGMAAGFNELGFAKEIAPKFQPKRALPRSSSFKTFWERLELKCPGNFQA